MKVAPRSIFRCFDSAEHRREIEAELGFHLELLTEEHLHQDLSLAEAKAAALKRFGNVELIKDQCLDISRRSHPMMPAIKVLLIAVFLVGVLIRINSAERNVTHLGDLLIVMPILCRLLLYVRSISPSRFLSDRTGSPLMLNETVHPPFTIYDHRKLTPVERVISDK